ncbi:MAG: hypothetical protein HY818_11495 [Acetobacterium woodii]|nr:hypothetical protein [Acetobacterium woodii]
MSFYNYDYVRVSVTPTKANAQRTIKKLKQTMPDIELVVIEGTIIDEKLAEMLKNADQKSPRVIGDDQVFDLFGV